MKLEKMKRFPKRAGRVELQFGYRGKKKLPLRRNNRIIFPDPKHSPNSEFFQLKGGKQFLFYSLGYDEAWFGGTDENPFLVRLDIAAWKVLRDEGEKAFFDALEPFVAKKWKEIFGATKLKRQGDIWVIPLELSFEQLNKSYFILWEGGATRLLDVKRRTILGTRHVLTGHLFDFGGNVVGSIEGSSHEYHRIMVGEGILESPNHKPRKLNGLHLLTQTALLFDSAKAD